MKYKHSKQSPCRRPRQHMGRTAAHSHKYKIECETCNHLVGRYPGWWNDLHRLPKRVFKTLSGCDGSEIAKGFVHLPLRGQRRLGFAVDGKSLLLPVELRRVNHTASTNERILQLHH